ncbi:ATP-dependent RNA helicase DBP9 [Euphorbia peplus]|nr:ATP-dependent RNA helicase DBP9 [Euphorbia peplus]
MAKTKETPQTTQPEEKFQEDEPKKTQEEEQSKDKNQILTFEELGLDPRLIRALSKREISITTPTPIQQVAIPPILKGKDVIAKAKTGSGKTLAYVLPLLQKLFGAADSGAKKKVAPSAFILVPTRELCQQVHKEVMSNIEWCKVKLKAVELTSKMPISDLRTALAGPPDIVVSTPACVVKCLSSGILDSASINDSLDMLVLDEADLLLSFGYEDDIRVLSALLSKRCQCLLMSATASADVDKLKKLILHNPCDLIEKEVTCDKDEEAIPKNIQQFLISCNDRDKLLHILALLKLELVQKKVLIFTNTIDMSFRLKLFLEKFGIKSAVLNAELPQNSRLHMLEEFNAGLFDYLIATDDKDTKEKLPAENVESNNSKKKKPLDSEFGVVRGIDFKNVYTVINYDMPLNAEGYVHRIGRTGRAYSTGTSISLVSPNDMEIFEDVKKLLGNNENKDSNFISPFTLLTKNAVESLRYRAEDTAKSVTKIAVREARAQDLRNEILNSEKLKAHFQANPKDLALLKHDKVLSKTPSASHLRDVPDYLVDASTKEASKMIKLARAAMGNTNSNNSRRNQGSNKRKSRRNKDPLKSFSDGAPKKGGRQGKDGDNKHKHKKGRTF